MTVFTMDGVEYNLNVIDLKRAFSITDTDQAGRSTSGNMQRDIIGTYYNYTVTVDAKRMSLTDYDNFYQQVSAPVVKHTMTFPYGQSVLTFDAYVTSGEDNLFIDQENKKHWSGLSITFTAMEPKRRPA